MVRQSTHLAGWLGVKIWGNGILGAFYKLLNSTVNNLSQLNTNSHKDNL